MTAPHPHQSNTCTAERTQQSVADQLGVSVRAVQQTEYRALHKLRRAIEQEAQQAGLCVKDWLFEG